MIARHLAGVRESTARTAAESQATERCDSRRHRGRSPGRRSSRQPHVTASNIKRVGVQSRRFCAMCTFCARFRHATIPPRSRSALRDSFRSRISRDRTTPYANDRMLFDRCRNAADALRRRSNVRLTRHRSAPAPRKTAARLSSPGPLLLFFLAARVKDHTSRLARAHHQGFPKLSGETFLVCEV